MGEWFDQDGFRGLANFACAQCLQVVKPSYVPFDLLNTQELYFASQMHSTVWINAEKMYGLMRDAGLQHNVADSFRTESKRGKVRLVSAQVRSACLSAHTRKLRLLSIGQDQEVETPLLVQVTCSDVFSVRQLFTVSYFPTLMINQYVVTHMARLRQVSDFVEAIAFYRLDFVFSCGILALGQWNYVWQLGSIA